MGTSSNFSIDEFRRWIKDHHQDDIRQNKKSHSLIGSLIESKVSEKKIISRMTVEEGDQNQLAAEFVEQGGRVAEVNGTDLLIEVSVGKFYLSRVFTRRA